MMKSIFLALTSGMLLAGCALEGDGYVSNSAAEAIEQFTQGCEVVNGPRAQWTPQQRAQYAVNLAEFCQMKVAQLNAQPERRYQPIIYSQEPEQRRKVYSVWGTNGGTSQIKADGRGGYTVWNSDGTTGEIKANRQAGTIEVWSAANSATSTLQSDGHGGYTAWNSNGTTSTLSPDGNGGWVVRP